MAKTLKIKKVETKVETLNKIANIEPLSRTKAFKMKNKMLTAFKELKSNQRKLKTEHDSLLFAQNELKNWQDNYVKLFNLANVGYFTVYKDLIVKEVNKAGIKLLGYDKFEIIAQPIIVHAEHACRDTMRNYFSSVFDSGTAEIELTLMTANEKPIEVLLYSVLISEEGSSQPCCLSAVIDKTAVNTLKSQIDHYQTQLKQLAERHSVELNTVVEKQQKDSENHSKAVIEFQQEIEKLMNTIDSQKDEIENIKSLNQRLEQDLENVCVVKDKFSAKCDDYEALIKEQAFDLASLKGQLEQAVKENEKLVELKATQDNHKHDADKKREELESKIEHLEKKLSDFEQDNVQLKGRIAVVNQQSKDSQAQSNLEKQKLASMVRQRSKKIAQLVERIEKIKSTTGSVIDDLRNRLDDTERVLSGKVNELTLINEKLQEQVSRARTETQTHRSKSNFLEKQLNQAQSELAAAQKEIRLQTNIIRQNETQAAAERDGLVEKLSAKTDEFDMLNEAYLQQKKDNEKLTGLLKEQSKQRCILQASLKQNRMMLQRLCEVGAITMNVYNLKQRQMAYVNRHIGEVLGYSQQQIDEFGDDMVSKIMHPDDLARINGDLADFSWDSPEEVIDIEYRLQDAHGSWRYIQSQEVVLSCDDQGKPFEVLGIQYDFTEKVQAREGMKALAKIVALVGKE